MIEIEIIQVREDQEEIIIKINIFFKELFWKRRSLTVSVFFVESGRMEKLRDWLGVLFFSIYCQDLLIKYG